MIKKVGRYWVDKNGNKWDSYSYTQEEAEKMSKKMKKMF